MLRSLNNQASIYPITAGELKDKLEHSGDRQDDANEEDMFERFCRICAAAHEVGIKIFSDEGKTRLLPDKISKYLHFDVQIDDDLPKMICLQCCAQLDCIKDFAEMAKQAQVILKARIDTINDNKQKLSERSSLEFVNVTDKFIDIEESIDIKLEKIETSEDESQMSVTEMEVQVDPMMFLECASEDSRQAECNDQNFNKELIKTAEILRENGVEMRKEIKQPRPIRSVIFHKPIKRKIIHKEKPFECNYCSRSFLTDISLKNHLWVHGLKSISAISEKVLTANPAFSRGPGYPRLAPKIRGSDLPEGNGNDLLIVKSEIIEGDSKLACKFCQRIFKSPQNLKKHMESHNTLTFECEVCARVYPTRSTLRAHSVSHSEARPHKCPVCKKTFKRTQDLKFHINQHTGERPYSCPYCKKTFASSGNCFSHRKRMHPLEVQRDKSKGFKKT